jgi:hypothetical protein
MADDRRTPRSLNEKTADQIRNKQRGGAHAPVDPNVVPGPEGNATMRRAWSEPGGEPHNFRNATIGAGPKADDHGELTAAETPEATRRLGDATLAAHERDATGDAIARAGAPRGKDKAKD